MNRALARRAASTATFVAVAAAIFALTAMSPEGTTSMSGAVSDLVEASTGVTQVVVPPGSEPDARTALMAQVTNVRKWAHAVEFAALGLAAFWMTRSWTEGSSARGRDLRAALWAAAACAAYSLLDQTHKLFVPGREFDPTDLPFDALGYASAIGAACLVAKWRSKRSRGPSVKWGAGGDAREKEGRNREK